MRDLQAIFDKELHTLNYLKINFKWALDDSKCNVIIKIL